MKLVAFKSSASIAASSLLCSSSEISLAPSSLPSFPQPRDVGDILRSYPNWLETQSFGLFKCSPAPSNDAQVRPSKERRTAGAKRQQKHYIAYINNNPHLVASLLASPIVPNLLAVHFAHCRQSASSPSPS